MATLKINSIQSSRIFNASIIVPPLMLLFSLLPKFLTKKKASRTDNKPKATKAQGHPKVAPINHAIVGVNTTPIVPPTPCKPMASETLPLKAFEISEFAVG